MTSEAGLIVIAFAAGLAVERQPMNPPKVVGFCKLVDGRPAYAIPRTDFEAIVESAQGARQPFEVAIAGALWQITPPGVDGRPTVICVQAVYPQPIPESKTPG